MKQLTMKEARKKAGLTQAQLADKLKCSHVFVHAIEAGEGFPRLETLVRVEEVLGQNIRWGDAPTPPEIVDRIIKILQGVSDNYPVDTTMEYLTRLIRSKDKTAEQKLTLLRIMAGEAGPEKEKK